ncbi:heptaprenyl diphosphate synthase component 1 [Peribacillus sp. FSL H8-0477]|jgi:heptaprenyl diphosphate synthase|uniref:heptaprenyl diphosphate synthase component 1 n=1 Tax=Peribacillus sp. FSL H8-0477 TaxID=2921388 RepID=UPI0030F9499B
MLNINNTVIELKKSIKSKAYHPYLQKILDEPKIDEDKLLLLAGLFNELEKSSEEIHTDMLATMMVQVALDTHELVTISSKEIESGDELKNRQLNVLAGDYFSGLYYQLLAESGNVVLIKILSSGIKEINEHKISLYQKSFTDEDKLVSGIKIIESSLIQKLAEYFAKPEWMELAGAVLLVNRLHLEKMQYKAGGQSLVFDALAEINFPQQKELTRIELNYLSTKMDKCIMDAQHMTKKAAVKLSSQNDFVQQWINTILDETAIKANSFVEEG